MVRIIFLIIVLIALTFTTLSQGYAAENPLYIGILPYYAPDKIWVFYRPFIAYLNETTGLPWDLRLYHSYDALIDGICSGEVAIAYLGPVPFSLAYEKCRIRPLVVALGDDGKPFYQSIIFTNNQQITSLNDLRGKTFAFGDRESTSSFIIPKKMLQDSGISMDMIKPLFLKSHEKIIKAVAKNEAVAGATKTSVYKRFKKLGFKTLLVSEPLPHHSFCTFKITPDIERRFTKALLKLKPQNHIDRNIMKNWDPELRNGFSTPPDDYIQQVLKIDESSKNRDDR